MTRSLAVGVGSVALLSSAAFAAGFDINDGQDTLADVSTGSVTVDDCTNDLLLDVVPGAYDDGVGDWEVESIMVTAATGDLAVSCDGFDFLGSIETVDYETSATTTVVVEASRDGTGTPAAAASTVTLVPNSTTYLRDVVDVAVLVDQPDLTPSPS